MPGWLSLFLTFIRGIFNIRADIQQKQQEHVGEVIQQNTDLKARAEQDEAALKADANAPRSKADKLAALLRGEE